MTEATRTLPTPSAPAFRIAIPLVVGCAFFMEGLDSTMIAVSIPAMAKSLGESPLRLNLVITTYLLSLAVFIPVSGWIADRLGTRRRVLRRGADLRRRLGAVRPGDQPADAGRRCASCRGSAAR